MSPLKETWNGKESYEHQLASNDSQEVLDLEDQSLNSFELHQRIDCHMQMLEKNQILKTKNKVIFQDLELLLFSSSQTLSLRMESLKP